jgi:hypothetical protein
MKPYLEPRFVVSGALLAIGAGCVFGFANSNPHMILGTNLITGIAGYWIGTSDSSAKKDNALFKKENQQ